MGKPRDGIFIDQLGRLIQWVCIAEDEWLPDGGWVNQAEAGQPMCYHRIVVVDPPIIRETENETQIC